MMVHQEPGKHHPLRLKQKKWAARAVLSPSEFYFCAQGHVLLFILHSQAKIASWVSQIKPKALDYPISD